MCCRLGETFAVVKVGCNQPVAKLAGHLGGRSPCPHWQDAFTTSALRQKTVFSHQWKSGLWRAHAPIKHHISSKHPLSPYPTEYRSCIVRKGNSVCPKAVDRIHRNRAKRFGGPGQGETSQRQQRAKMSTYWHWGYKDDVGSRLLTRNRGGTSARGPQ